MYQRRSQFRPTCPIRTPTGLPAQTVTHSTPSTSNTTPQKSALINGPAAQRLKDSSTNAVSQSNNTSSAVRPAPDASASRTEALIATRQSLANTAAPDLPSQHVTNSRGETVPDSSMRHKKHHRKAQRGEKRDVLPTPFIEAQETNNDPGAVTPRPTEAPSSRKAGDKGPRVVQPIKETSKSTTTAIQPEKGLSPRSPSNSTGRKSRRATVTSDLAGAQPPAQAKNKEPRSHPENSTPLTTVAQEATQRAKAPVQGLQGEREAKTKPVLSQPMTPKSSNPPETAKRPKAPTSSRSKKSPNTPSAEPPVAPERPPIEPAGTSPRASSPVRSPPQTQKRDKTLEVALPPAQVRFTDGMQIRCITTHHESTRIVLKGWPSHLKEEDIKSHLQSYGKIYFVTVTQSDSGEKVAHVRFSQHQEAVATLREIEEGKIDLGPWPSRVTAAFDTSIAPTLKGTNISSSTVVLSWNVPAPKLKVFYYTPEKAKQWAMRISGWTRDGRQLVARVRRPKEAGVPARTMVIENLSENTNIARFGSDIRADDRPSWLPNHYDHNVVIAQVRKVIDSFARDVSFDQNGQHVTFRCIFRNSEDTKAFMALANQQEWPWRGAAKFQMTQYVDVLYVVRHAHFTAVEKQLDDLRTKLEAMRVSMRVTTPPEADNVRHILISGSLGLRGAKRLTDRLLAGEVVKDNGKVLWDEDVNSFYGSSILLEIDVPGTYISINRRNQSYIVHGPFDQRGEAASLLIDRVRRAKTHLNVHEFPRNQLHWWAAKGLPLIRERAEEANFWLDPLHCRITVRGNGLVMGRLRHCINKARDSWHPPPRPVNGGTLSCPACFEEASDPVRIGCKHVYCHDCFTAFLASTARHGGPLPIKCFGDDGKCPQLVSMYTVSTYMQKVDLQRLATKVLEMHVGRQQDGLRYCPTPDCAYIYRVQEKITEPPVVEISKGAKSKRPKGNPKRMDTPSGAPNPKAEIPSATIQCPGCLVKICAGCHSAAHDRQTCDAVQVEKEKNDKLFQTWLKTSGAKYCPKCLIPLLKDGGCNHVRCGACRTHICWVCLKAFKDEGEKESVYEHIRREHGGSVFGDTHVVAWEARLEDIDEATLLAALGAEEDRLKPAAAATFVPPRGELWEYPPPPPPPAEPPKKEPLPAHAVHALYRPNRRRERGGVAQAQGQRRRRWRERGDPTWNPLHFIEYEYPEDESDDPIVWPKQWKRYEHEIPDWWGEYEDYDPEWL